MPSTVLGRFLFCYRSFPAALSQTAMDGIAAMLFSRELDIPPLQHNFSN